MSAPKISRRGTVRGTARRVVIVPQPDGGAFEQAIFIVRGDCAVTETELLRQALEAAGADHLADTPEALGDYILA